MKEYRIQEYKKSITFIDRYMKGKKDFAFIHYACQGFYSNVCDKTPRIIAICVLMPNSMQKHSFSIVTLAEIQSIDLDQADEVTLDQLEKEMLKEFYNFVKGIKRELTWLHWNMKDCCFGFTAIEQRYRRLNNARKVPFVFSDDKKINLAAVLKQRYGDNYVQRPHLQNILKLNDIQPKNILSGEEEAAAYERREYLSMQRSLEDKVAAFSEILDKIGNGELKTQSKILRDIYGVSWKGIFTYVRENIVLGLSATAIGGFIWDIIKELLVAWLTGGN